MKIEQNAISRDWVVIYRGRKFYVNFTERDGYTLALCNRYSWEIYEETKTGTKELDPYVPINLSSKDYNRVKRNYCLFTKLVKFCIEHWDNEFVQKLKMSLNGYAASVVVK